MELIVVIPGNGLDKVGCIGAGLEGLADLYGRILVLNIGDRGREGLVHESETTPPVGDRDNLADILLNALLDIGRL